MTASHILPDVLVPNLRIVFCGTAAGRMSAATRTYYAHPQNQFWRALASAGLTPYQFAPRDYGLLLQYGIGLTDLAKHHAGMDAQIPAHGFDRVALEEKIRRYCPRILAFTSKTAGRIYCRHAVAYGLQAESIGTTRIVVLPSPSPAARHAWNLAYWHELRALAEEELRT